MTEIDLTPITRLEYDIDAILNDHAVAEPITRIELILADIVAGNTTTVVPVTRIETYLAIISGADYSVPEPVTRIETFLAIIAGGDYEAPEPATRLEGLLAEWVEKGSGIWKTVSGSLIHITDALASPVRELSVTIEPQQSGSGDPSPTNVRPITGWTGCDIWHTGSNICGGERLKERLVYSMPTGTLNTDAKTFKFSSTIDAPYWVYSFKNYPFKENTRYTFIITCSKSSGTSTNLRIFYTDGTFDNLSNIPTSKTMNVFVSAAGKTVDHFSKYTASGTTTLYYEESGIFEGVLTADDFEPYSGTTLSVTFPDSAGTVYGGTLTVNEDGSADLVSTLGYFDPYEKISKFIQGSGNVYINSGEFTKYGFKYPIDVTICKSNTFKALSASSALIPSFSVSSGGTFAVNGAAGITDTVENWTTYITDNHASNPIYFILELSTPVTYHLDSIEQITTLAGENNIWADVNGTITLTYKEDGRYSDTVGIGKADFMKLLS